MGKLLDLSDPVEPPTQPESCTTSMSEPKPKKDLAGMTFGRWRVLGPFRRQGKHQHIHWLVECSCEAKTQRYVEGSNLTSGASTNCGCERKRKVTALMTRRGVLEPLDDVADKEERDQRWKLRGYWSS
jgi:hypothetical protein